MSGAKFKKGHDPDHAHWEL